MKGHCIERSSNERLLIENRIKDHRNVRLNRM